MGSAGSACPPEFGPTETWTELPPPARSEHVAVFDSKHHRLVVFGGWFGRWNMRDDVWVLPLGRPADWERVVPAGESPTARVGAAAIYDPVGDRMILIGGRDTTGCLNDVWELSLKGRFTWRKITPAGTPPSTRTHHTATLDPEHDRILVFGGEKEPWHLEDNDVWQLSLGQPLEWTRLATTGVRPSRRAYHTAVCAPDLHALVVFGGTQLRPGMFGDWDLSDTNDVWLLPTEGTPTWTNLTPLIAGQPPCGLQGHVAAYDPELSRMTVFGGYAEDWRWRPCRGLRSTAWSLSLRDLEWTALPSAADGPRARMCATAVWDAESRRIVTYGGKTELFGGSTAMADGWALDPRGSPIWSRVYPELGLPKASSEDGQSTIYDPVRDRVILYERQELWSYSFRDHGGWARLTPEGPLPPLESGHVAIYDSKRDRMIVYGGRVGLQGANTEAWALSLDHPMAWSRLNTLGDAPVRSRAAAVFDPGRDRMVMFGGDSLWYAKGDVWALSLGDAPMWTRLVPDDGWRLHRAKASAVFDSKRDRMVIFGGGTPGGECGNLYNDTWELPLSGEPLLKQLTPESRSPGVPERRAFQGAVYDPVGDRLIIIGGYCSGAFPYGPWEDSWALDLAALEWTRLSPGGGAVPTWTGPLVAYDTRRGAAVVMGSDHVWRMTLGGGRPGRAGLGPPLPALAEAESDGTGTLSLALRGARPNPFAGDVVAEFSLPDAGPATLELLDLSGRRVWEQGIGALGAGRHSAPIARGTNLPPGIYLLRLTHGPTVLTAKVVSLR